MYLTKIKKKKKPLESFIIFPVAKVPQNKPKWGEDSKPESTVKAH